MTQTCFYFCFGGYEFVVVMNKIANGAAIAPTWILARVPPSRSPCFSTMNAHANNEKANTV